MMGAVQVDYAELDTPMRKPIPKVTRTPWCTSEKCNPQSLNKGKEKLQVDGVFCIDCGSALYWECNPK
jgi:hypothetical protein